MSEKAKSKLNKKKIAVIAGIAVVAVVGISIVASGFSGEKGEVTYTEATAKIEDLTSYYSYDGTISAGKSQTVYAPSVCEVKTLAVKVGDTVSEGDLLVAYDSGSNNSLASANASLSSAQLSVNTAKSNLERITSLYEIGGVSTEEYESAQNNLASAQIQLTQAQANYQTAVDNQSDSTVTAKVSGMVTSVSVNEGDDLTSGTEVMEIISYDSLEVEIVIDEYDMKVLEVGMEAKVTVNSTAEEVKGTVSELSKKATVTNGVSYFSGVIALEASETLSVGMSVEIQVATESIPGALTIPAAAVQFDQENGSYVYRKDMTKQKVEVGTSVNSSVEIKSGLEEGDVVMVPAATEEGSGDQAMPGAMGGGMPGGGQQGGRPADGGAPSGGPSGGM